MPADFGTVRRQFFHQLRREPQHHLQPWPHTLDGVKNAADIYGVGGLAETLIS